MSQGAPRTRAKKAKVWQRPPTTIAEGIIFKKHDFSVCSKNIRNHWLKHTCAPKICTRVKPKSPTIEQNVAKITPRVAKIEPWPKIKSQNLAQVNEELPQLRYMLAKRTQEVAQRSQRLPESSQNSPKGTRGNQKGAKNGGEHRSEQAKRYPNGAKTVCSR